MLHSSSLDILLQKVKHYWYCDLVECSLPFETLSFYHHTLYCGQSFYNQTSLFCFPVVFTPLEFYGDMIDYSAVIFSFANS